MHVTEGTEGSTRRPMREHCLLQLITARYKKQESSTACGVQPTGGIKSKGVEAGANIMSDRLQELERRLGMAEAENQRKDEQLRRSFQELEEAVVEIWSYQTQVDRYAAERE